MSRRRSVLAPVLAAAGLLATGACAAEGETRNEVPPRYEARTGVPVLMDLPVLGFLFRRTTTVR